MSAGAAQERGSADANARLDRAAAVSLGGTATFVALLAVLHGLKPEIDPSWRFISEYAIGRHGWLMQLAFFSLAVGYLALAAALRPRLRSIGGRVGLVMMVVSAVGLIVAGLFTTDPITTSADAATTNGQLHSLGGTLGMAMPFATAFVTWKMARDAAWAGRRWLVAAAVIAIGGFVVSLASLGFMLSASNGEFGPSVLVGWPNRLEVLGYCVWLVVAARQALRAPLG